MNVNIVDTLLLYVHTTAGPFVSNRPSSVAVAGTVAADGDAARARGRRRPASWPARVPSFQSYSRLVPFGFRRFLAGAGAPPNCISYGRSPFSKPERLFSYCRCSAVIINFGFHSSSVLRCPTSVTNK